MKKWYGGEGEIRERRKQRDDVELFVAEQLGRLIDAGLSRETISEYLVCLEILYGVEYREAGERMLNWLFGRVVK